MVERTTKVSRVKTVLRELTIPHRPALLASVAMIMAGLGFLYFKTYEMAPSFLPGYPGDAFFPRLVLGFTAIFGGLILVRGWVRRSGPQAERVDEQTYITIDWLEITIVSALVLAYVLLLKSVGFEITTTLFITALLAPRLLMPWPSAIVVALISAFTTMLVIYVSFGLGLKVYLPLRFLPLYI